MTTAPPTRVASEDGLLGDDGPAGDGRIVDPGGPALAVQSAVPVASTWGLAALVGLLAVAALFGLWRQGPKATIGLALALGLCS